MSSRRSSVQLDSYRAGLRDTRGCRSGISRITRSYRPGCTTLSTLTSASKNQKSSLTSKRKKLILGMLIQSTVALLHLFCKLSTNTFRLVRLTHDLDVFQEEQPPTAPFILNGSPNGSGLAEGSCAGGAIQVRRA